MTLLTFASIPLVVDLLSCPRFREQQLSRSRYRAKYMRTTDQLHDQLKEIDKGHFRSNLFIKGRGGWKVRKVTVGIRDDR